VPGNPNSLITWSQYLQFGVNAKSDRELIVLSGMN
jgi:hypothetical protein